jgi:hypothetical protein
MPRKIKGEPVLLLPAAYRTVTEAPLRTVLGCLYHATLYVRYYYTVLAVCTVLYCTMLHCIAILISLAGQWTMELNRCHLVVVVVVVFTLPKPTLARGRAINITSKLAEKRTNKLARRQALIHARGI